MSGRSGGRTLGSTAIDTSREAKEKLDGYSPRARAVVLKALVTLPRKAGGPAVPYPDRDGYLVIVHEVQDERPVGIVYRYASKFGVFARVYEVADFIRPEYRARRSAAGGAPRGGR